METTSTAATAAAATPGIAARLRGLRDAMNMDEGEFAEALGVDTDLVRLYESGREEIPVSYLSHVAHVFEMDLTVLVSGGEAHLTGYSVVRAGRGMAVERRRDYDYKNLAYRFAGRRMEPFHITVPPKEAGELSFTSHPGQEFIYLIAGRLEVTLENETVVLEPGDSLYFSSSVTHALRGLDGKPAEFIDVIA